MVSLAHSLKIISYAVDASTNSFNIHYLFTRITALITYVYTCTTRLKLAHIYWIYRKFSLFLSSHFLHETLHLYVVIIITNIIFGRCRWHYWNIMFSRSGKKGYQTEFSVYWSSAENQRLKERILTHIDSNAGSSLLLPQVDTTSSSSNSFTVSLLDIRYLLINSTQTCSDIDSIPNSWKINSTSHQTLRLLYRR